MRTIVSTIGTSTLTNGAPPEIRALLNTHANASEQELREAGALQEVQNSLDAKTLELAGLDLAGMRRASAEINGIVALYGKDWAARGKDLHFLVASDTFQGGAAAELVRAWLDKQGVQVQVQTVDGLSTRCLAAFRRAMTEVVRWCETLRPEGGQYQVIYNLTGGFKAVNGFLQTVGAFYADEVVYLFESGTELLRIPRLPLTLDCRETVAAHLSKLRLLALHVELPLADCQGIPETFLFELEGRVALSEWGELLWQRTRREIYAEKLWPSPSPRVRFGRDFERESEGIARNSQHLPTVNERVDDLVGYQLAQRNPTRLDLKKIKGGPLGPSTHEADAWRDGAAMRLFLHFEGDVLVVDRLGDALHP